ncbi:MAG: MaoC family dehydratase [Janthinobacterium lividum]
MSGAPASPQMSLDTLAGRVGEEIGYSEWFLVTQENVDLFARATGDMQWIHVDVQRCKTQSPYGGTIAHGLYTLSLLPALMGAACDFSAMKLVINYGFNKVRFPAVVPVGSRVRASFVLVSIDPVETGAQLVIAVTVEREHGDRPVCVAESVLRILR